MALNHVGNTSRIAIARVVRKMVNTLKHYTYEIAGGSKAELAPAGRCIYCGADDVALTDEHVIPYALAANVVKLPKSSCDTCQKIIQPYEQHVLKKQLGNFRAQVDAPTRRKNERIKEVAYDFKEVNLNGEFVRDLPSRSFPIDEAPLVLNLWRSPPPAIFYAEARKIGDGQPWHYYEQSKLQSICDEVANMTGAVRAAVHIGDINRVKYLRFLAKVGHGIACAYIGCDGFDPLLLDVILNRDDGVSYYVGDDYSSQGIVDGPDHSIRLALGVAKDEMLPEHVVVSLQLYPKLNSPIHVIAVGRSNQLTRERLDALIGDG